MRVATLPSKTSVSENKRHAQTNVVIDNKSHHPYCYKFIGESASEKLFKSANIWQNYRQEGWLHVDDRVSCDVDDADECNRSFCGLRSTDAVKIFLSVNSIILTSPDSTFQRLFLNGWILHDSLSFYVGLFHPYCERGNFSYQIFSLVWQHMHGVVMGSLVITLLQFSWRICQLKISKIG